MSAAAKLIKEKALSIESIADAQYKRGMEKLNKERQASKEEVRSLTQAVHLICDHDQGTKLVNRTEHSGNHGRDTDYYEDTQCAICGHTLGSKCVG